MTFDQQLETLNAELADLFERNRQRDRVREAEENARLLRDVMRQEQDMPEVIAEPGTKTRVSMARKLESLRKAFIQETEEFLTKAEEGY